MPSSVPNRSPYQTDRTPRVSIWVDGEEQLFVEEYSLDQDVLNLGDPFRVSIPNVDGRNANRYRPGALCKVFMSDPTLENTASVQKYLGRVTQVDYQVDPQRGSKITIAGADLGWHLRECHAPMWVRIPGGITFANLVDRLIPPDTLTAWGFSGVAFDNLYNRKINQGRGGIERTIARDESGGRAFIAPLQVEPGQSAAEFLIEFARRAGRLVNVSSDGYIQFFVPNDSGFVGPLAPGDTGASYKLRLYKSTSVDASKGNVKSARVTHNLDGIYTETVCVGTVVQSNRFVQANSEDPNRTRFRGTYTPSPAPLAWPRTFYFCDGDQLNREMARKRAAWKYYRGQFDAFSAEYTVAGHAQNGIFWAADTLVDVIDEVNGLSGVYYISAVRYNRSMQSGTTTTLTVRAAGTLAA